MQRGGGFLGNYLCMCSEQLYKIHSICVCWMTFLECLLIGTTGLLAACLPTSQSKQGFNREKMQSSPFELYAE